jgi:16S rRNA A1518/A1519 N6-dimethyltransferase RsmA/KsgA/DIM1 with predicted DNA glycosylase/AP lyase activity
VLEVGAGPGRFTHQLAELGARILVATFRRDSSSCTPRRPRRSTT